MLPHLFTDPKVGSTLILQLRLLGFWLLLLPFIFITEISSPKMWQIFSISLSKLNIHNLIAFIGWGGGEFFFSSVVDLKILLFDSKSLKVFNFCLFYSVQYMKARSFALFFKFTVYLIVSGYNQSWQSTASFFYNISKLCIAMIVLAKDSWGVPCYHFYSFEFWSFFFQDWLPIKIANPSLWYSLTHSWWNLNLLAHPYCLISHLEN